MADSYEYRHAGRCPLIIASLGLVNAGFTMAAIAGAPAAIWPLWIVALALLIHHVLANPDAGMRIDADSWTTCNELRTIRVALAEIDWVEIIGGGAAVILIRKDGARLRLSRTALPPLATLTAKLKAHGIRLHRATTPGIEKHPPADGPLQDFYKKSWQIS